jgi:hypothetical protein
VTTVSDTIEGMHVKSRVGVRKQRDHFVATETPKHHISVENRNGEACDVEIEIAPESDIILVEDKETWRSKRMRHGYIRSRTTRKWPYPARLSFTQADPGRPQVIGIKLFMAPDWAEEDGPLPQVGELKHTIWVS